MTSWVWYDFWWAFDLWSVVFWARAKKEGHAKAWRYCFVVMAQSLRGRRER